MRKGKITPYIACCFDKKFSFGVWTSIDFSELEIPLQKKVSFHMSDEIRSSTLVKCGLMVT